MCNDKFICVYSLSNYASAYNNSIYSLLHTSFNYLFCYLTKFIT